MVLFYEGREIFRVDGRLYQQYFKEALSYVSGAYYKRLTLSEYEATCRESLLQKGVDVNFAE